VSSSGGPKSVSELSAALRIPEMRGFLCASYLGERKYITPNVCGRPCFTSIADIASFSFTFFRRYSSSSSSISLLFFFRFFLVGLLLTDPQKLNHYCRRFERSKSR
jgi:hypothetical protein